MIIANKVVKSLLKQGNSFEQRNFLTCTQPTHPHDPRNPRAHATRAT